MRASLKIALIATTAIGWAAPIFAQATPPSNAESHVSDDIIVTARRSEERLQDVPISITVLSQDAIAKRNIVSSVDLGIYVPSLSTNQTFGPEKASFSIRGFTQEGKTSPSVAVYFADVVAPRSNGGTTSGNGAGVGSFMDLQNVQVLKGPQGTLFGRNSTGGAILLVPSKPTDKLEGYVQGSVGDYSMHRIEAVLNVPLSSSIRVRGAVDWNQRDGYLINKSGVGPRDFGNTNYFAGRLSVVADITPDLENYTIGSYSRSNTHGVLQKVFGCNRNYASAGGLVGLLGPFACGQVDRDNARGDGFWDVDNSDPNPQELIRQWQVINTTTLRATDTLNIKNIISYAQYRESADFNLFGDNFISTGQPLNFGQLGIFVGPTGPCAPGSLNCSPLIIPTAPGQTLPGITLHPGVTGNNSAQSTLTEELQFQGNLVDGRLNWQAGAYLEASKPLGFNSGTTQIFESCTDYATLQCTNPLLIGSLSSSNVKDTFNSKAFYAQATYKLTTQFSLTGGFRYTWDKITSESRNINISVPTPGTGIYSCQNVVQFNVDGDISKPLIVGGPLDAKCDSVLHQDSSRPTWLVDLDYKPTRDILIYAKWARGYRQGAINSNNLGLEIAKPEKINTFEAGGKTSFRGAVPGYFNIAGFYNNLTNQQLAVSSVVAPQFQGKVPNAQPILNAGKARTWGIEVDASLRPATGFKVDVGYAYLNTKLISFIQPPLPIYYSALFPSADVGQPLALSPKNRVSLTGTYTLPLDRSIGPISIGATFTHTDANRGVSPKITPNYLIPAANLLNLNAEWDAVFGRPIDLAFFMTNVTNQKLVVFPAASFVTNGQITGQLNQPRMFGFRAKLRFGS